MNKTLQQPTIHQPEEEKVPQWIVTYGDLMTLLLTFFVLFYGLTVNEIWIEGEQEEKPQYGEQHGPILGERSKGSEQQGRKTLIKTISRKYVEPIQKTLQPEKEKVDITADETGLHLEISQDVDPEQFVKKIEEFIEDNKLQGKVQLLVQDNQLTMVPVLEEEQERTIARELTMAQKIYLQQKRRLRDLAYQIQAQALEEGMSEEAIRIVADQWSVKIIPVNELLFDSGSATLRPGSSKILDLIGHFLQEESNVVLRVTGHTDNVPIRTVLFPSNWELSAARATSILRYYLEHFQIKPVRIECQGRGEWQPVAENSTPEGRARNRRTELEVILQPAFDEKVLLGTIDSSLPLPGEVSTDLQPAQLPSTETEP